MNETTISWTGTYQPDGTLKPGHTSNPIRARNVETGKAGHFCEKVSPGCAHCYASEWNENRYGTGVPFLPANRDKLEVYLVEHELAEWAKPKYAGAKVFPFDMTDLFGEWVPDDWIERILCHIVGARDLTFQVLTKRPERMRAAILSFHRELHLFGEPWPIPNLWLGVSAENQRWADERIPVLLDTPAAVRFVSYEPALQAVDFERYIGDECSNYDLLLEEPRSIDWLICGAESGPRRRPFNLSWARSALSQCRFYDTAFWMKQGSAPHSESYESLPEDLKVRDFPR